MAFFWNIRYFNFSVPAQQIYTILFLHLQFTPDLQTLANKFVYIYPFLPRLHSNLHSIYTQIYTPFTLKSTLRSHSNPHVSAAPNVRTNYFFFSFFLVPTCWHFTIRCQHLFYVLWGPIHNGSKKSQTVCKPVSDQLNQTVLVTRPSYIKQVRWSETICSGPLYVCLSSNRRRKFWCNLWFLRWYEDYGFFVKKI